ncbi:MAG: type II secretion system protein [Phycisphaerales bacterium]|nr:type II secretion system protein [Phycisphaerales bacterium]
MLLRSSNPAKSGKAFTLVEVLLGIIILAVGLLGLASVFPLVVRQQREAQDTVVGVSAARAAESFLTQHQGYFDITAPNDMIGLNTPSGKNGWGALSWAMYKTAWAKRAEDFGHIRWSTLFNENNPDGQTAIYGSNAEIAAGALESAPPIRGAMYFPRYSNNALVPNKGVAIKPYDRLIPMPSANTKPIFVWDVVPMLATPIDISPTSQITTQTTFPLRVTVFVRRIDQGIRLPYDQNTKTTMTLADAISQGKVLPLGSDADGMPSQNGLGAYPEYFYPTVQTAYRRYGAESGPFNVIHFKEAASAKSLAAARQVGQQLVDTEGNIYTVVALPDETGTDIPYSNVLDRAVVIEPGIPTGYLQSTTSKNENKSDVRTSRELELLCTPQVPAYVSTFLVRP